MQEGATLNGLSQQLVLYKDVYYLQIFQPLLEHIMCEALEYIGTSINGGIVNNLRFADDIDLIARQLGDILQLLNKVEEVSTR